MAGFPRERPRCAGGPPVCAGLRVRSRPRRRGPCLSPPSNGTTRRSVTRPSELPNIATACRARRALRVTRRSRRGCRSNRRGCSPRDDGRLAILAVLHRVDREQDRERTEQGADDEPAEAVMTSTPEHQREDESDREPQHGQRDDQCGTGHGNHLRSQDRPTAVPAARVEGLSGCARGQPGARPSVAGLIADNAAASDSCGDPFVATVVAPGHGSNRSRITAPISGVAVRRIVSGLAPERDAAGRGLGIDVAAEARRDRPTPPTRGCRQRCGCSHRPTRRRATPVHPASRSRRGSTEQLPIRQAGVLVAVDAAIQGVANVFQVADPGEILPDLVGAQQRPTEGIGDSGRKRRFP